MWPVAEGGDLKSVKSEQNIINIIKTQMGEQNKRKTNKRKAKNFSDIFLEETRLFSFYIS